MASRRSSVVSNSSTGKPVLLKPPVEASSGAWEASVASVTSGDSVDISSVVDWPVTTSGNSVGRSGAKVDASGTSCTSVDGNGAGEE